MSPGNINTTAVTPFTPAQPSSPARDMSYPHRVLPKKYRPKPLLSIFFKAKSKATGATVGVVVYFLTPSPHDRGAEYLYHTEA